MRYRRYAPSAHIGASWNLQLTDQIDVFTCWVLQDELLAAPDTWGLPGAVLITYPNFI